MTWTAILAEIASLANTVTGISHVFTRKVMYRDQAEFDARFYHTTDERYIGVEIFRSQKEDVLDNYNTFKETFTVEIRPFLGIKEVNDGSDTYTEIEALLDRLQNKFRRNLTVSGLALDSDLPVAGEIVPELYAEKWCWSVPILWNIRQRTTFTTSIS